VPNSFSTEGTVTIYPASVTGNVLPTATIAGPNTQLGPAASVAFDAAGNLYVRNRRGCNEFGANESVAVFAPGATGNVAPIRSISGPNTGLMASVNNLDGMAFDSAGNLYVANPGANVLIFAPGANGNVAPKSVLNNVAPAGIAIDSSDRLYVTGFVGVIGGGIEVFAAGASGNATPINTIAGNLTGLSLPVGVALDGHGNIYVSDLGAGKIFVFAPTASGNVPPIETISGSNTKLFEPAGIALDANGTVYESDLSGQVLTYAPGAFGNVAPSTDITGTNTRLSVPGLLALHDAPLLMHGNPPVRR
jgi:sugar lactone lactonase YvrE